MKRIYKPLVSAAILLLSSVSLWSYVPVSAQENGYPFDTYPVAKGDTLYSIAKDMGYTVKELIDFNHLTSTIIYPGQTLQVPPRTGMGPISKEYYIVKQGDTLYSIAKKLGISVSTLKEINHLSTNIIYPNQVLYSDFSRPFQVYYVKQGDTLYRIAKNYGISVETLKRVNYLNSNIIRIGQQLLIP